jgi:hypothetical protein
MQPNTLSIIERLAFAVRRLSNYVEQMENEDG